MIFKTIFVLLNAVVVTSHSESLSCYPAQVICNGMYSQNSIPKATNPGIIYLDIKPSSVNGVVSAAVFSVDLKDSVQTCSQSNQVPKLCSGTNLHSFYIDPPSSNSLASAFSQAYTAQSPVSFNFTVPEVGYYCVVVEVHEGDTPHDCEATISFQNPFGGIPATEYPKLLFYGSLSIVYALIGIFWIVKSIPVWSDLLRMQHILSGIIGFVLLDMILLYGYYAYYNLNSEPSDILLYLTVIVNSGRNAFSFFVLLVVSLGYGVIRPTLGKTMKKCVILAATHFIFGILYMYGSLSTMRMTYFKIFVFVFPLSVTMTIFYYATLNSLEQTIKTMIQRKQTVKLGMFKRLSHILLASAIMLLVFFAINFVYFSNRQNPSWLPTHWQWKWIVMDGILNIIYLFTFVSILWIWRPTKNNQRYGLTEIPQEEDNDAELGVIRDFNSPNWSDEVVFSKENDDNDVMTWAEQKFGFDSEDDVNRERTKSEMK